MYINGVVLKEFSIEKYIYEMISIISFHYYHVNSNIEQCDKDSVVDTLA